MRDDSDVTCYALVHPSGAPAHPLVDLEGLVERLTDALLPVLTRIREQGCLPEPREAVSVLVGAVVAVLSSRSPSCVRRKLPDERQSVTHKFGVGEWEGYLTVGLYRDNTPGEVFVKMSKEGSTISGLMDGWAIAISLALQYGVPLSTIVAKFSGMRFEPSGPTRHPEIHLAKSLLDYVVRWLGLRFLPPAARASLPPEFGPPCPNCGAPTTRGDGVWLCEACGRKAPGGSQP